MMNNQPENQNSIIAPGMPLSVGKTLGEARERLGLSVADVSNRIKFAPRQIEALEADDYVQLPEATFVRGFVRGYARLLQLDPEPLLLALPASHAQASSSHKANSVEIPMPSALSARRHNIVWLAAALVIAVSLAVFVRMRDHTPSTAEVEKKLVVQTLELPVGTSAIASAPVAEQVLQTEAASQQPENTLPAKEKSTIKELKLQAVQKTTVPTPVTVSEPKKLTQSKIVPEKHLALKPVLEEKPVVAKPVREPSKPVKQEAVREQTAVTNSSTATADASAAANSAAGFSEHALRLEFDEDAWVEIKDGNDKVLVSRMHPAGSLLRVTGKSPLDITIGNAKAVRLFDKGKKIHLGRFTTADVAHLKLKQP